MHWNVTRSIHTHIIVIILLYSLHAASIYCFNAFNTACTAIIIDAHLNACGMITPTYCNGPGA